MLNWSRADHWRPNPTGKFIFEVNNRNTRTKCQICSKLTIKTPERRQWHRSSHFIINFEHISHLVLVFFIVNFEQVVSNSRILVCLRSKEKDASIIKDSSKIRLTNYFSTLNIIDGCKKLSNKQKWKWNNTKLIHETNQKH